MAGTVQISCILHKTKLRQGGFLHNRSQSMSWLASNKGNTDHAAWKQWFICTFPNILLAGKQRLRDRGHCREYKRKQKHWPNGLGETHPARMRLMPRKSVLGEE
jgi:hypothetical protein